MEKRKIKYTRKSTIEQNEARQVEGLKDYTGELFTDKISGKIAFPDRPEGKKIIDAVKSGLISELIVFDVDRLGRDTRDILNTFHIMKTNKVCVTIHMLGIKSLVDGKSSPAFELVTTVMATLAQQEIERTKERQMQAIELIKEADKEREQKDKVYKGRKKGAKNKDSKSLVDKWKNVKACLDSNMSIDKTVAATGVSRSTVKRVRTEYFKTKNNK
ncbi:recombinase family protein [Ancylomarina sp.]|uniref:recombinase family protein n=1 Tax=Ancylomarina sp. TaxID=1970196 RepID=UPI0035654232